ncbi:MAG TPA: DUF3302 domain-containing protein [Spongiibacteraceae bacterium]|jgi:hypothetical protein|nr:DUF3302 domain-containing protein [Spongiibacteraceae bacterium]HUH36607.1 DUF3302 domain-containing protein [Spongiibacteraceae bacterium]
MLDYLALGILVFAVVTVFYGVIVIHDIPYAIAEKRQHPHSDAIHVAGWISLLTLHVLWPFLWIWATLYRPDRGWGFSKQSSQASVQTDQLEMQISALVARLEALESRAGDDAPAVEGGV